VAETKNLTGFKELADALKQLPKNVARKHLRGSVAKGATRIRKKARELAPKDTGEMSKDIQVKRERTAGDHIASYSVFVRSGRKSRLSGKARNVDKDSFYWVYQEMGTSKMAAHPFMRPAFEGEKEAAVDDIGAELDKRIQAEATDLGRQR
jgi:HK97 gp10 family phage protein